MKALPWILAGVAVGVCVILLLKVTEPDTESTTLETESATPEAGSGTAETESVTTKTKSAESAAGPDGVETAAPKKYGWGTKTLVGGKAG